MMQSGTNAAGTKGAADVNVESRLELQTAKLPNPDRSSSYRRQHQCIRSGLRTELSPETVQENLPKNVFSQILAATSSLAEASVKRGAGSH